MKFLFKAVALAAMLCAFTTPVLAQSLTTTYSSNNRFAGNTFDLMPATDMTVDSFDVNVGNPDAENGGAGLTATIAVYWRAGTSDGFESNPAGWTLLGTANVISQGVNNPTHVPVGGLALTAGQTYGIYVDVQGYDGSLNMLYTNGGPTVFSNSDLSLTTYYGKGDLAFVGSTFTYRQWNGTVYYTAGPATTCASEGYKGAKLTWCQNICENNLSGQVLDTWIHRWIKRYRDLPYCAVEELPQET